MDFPFSLNVGKTFPDLSLPDGRVSEFFLNSINSLGDPGVTSMMEGAPEKTIPSGEKETTVKEEEEGGDGGVKAGDTNENTTVDDKESATVEPAGNNLGISSVSTSSVVWVHPL